MSLTYEMQYRRIQRMTVWNAPFFASLHQRVLSYTQQDSLMDGYVELYHRVQHRTCMGSISGGATV